MKKKLIIVLLGALLFSLAIIKNADQNSSSNIVRNSYALADMEPEVSCQYQCGNLKANHWCFICNIPYCDVYANMQQTEFTGHCKISW